MYDWIPDDAGEFKGVYSIPVSGKFMHRNGITKELG
jgi:hypothetical protein